MKSGIISRFALMTVTNLAYALLIGALIMLNPEMWRVGGAGYIYIFVLNMAIWYLDPLGRSRQALRAVIPWICGWILAMLIVPILLLIILTLGGSRSTYILLGFGIVLAGAAFHLANRRLGRHLKTSKHST